MNTIVLHGVITEDGRLEIDLPKDLPAGKVRVEITETEEPHGISAQEILESDFVGMWTEREDIDDSVEYARALRKRAFRRKSHDLD